MMILVARTLLGEASLPRRQNHLTMDCGIYLGRPLVYLAVAGALGDSKKCGDQARETSRDSAESK